MNDPRYATIRPMYEKSYISAFLDIFRYVPKTIVAKDLRKKGSRFSAQLTHLENFDLGELFLIGNLCGLTRAEMLDLIKKEIVRQEGQGDNNKSL